MKFNSREYHILNLRTLLLKTALLSAVLLTTSSLSAERVARIMYYGASKAAPKTAFIYDQTGASQPVKLGRHHFSDSFEIPSGDIVLKFVSKELPDDQPVPETAPGLKIPKKWKKVLIMVSEDLENTVFPITLNAINASDDVFGPGELFFINFTDIGVFGLVGDKKLVLRPQATAVISNPASKREDYYVQLDSVESTIETRRWLLRQQWRHQPEQRFVYFVLPMPKPRVAKLYGTQIRDF
jgi:hypothetical protein